MIPENDKPQSESTELRERIAAVTEKDLTTLEKKNIINKGKHSANKKPTIKRRWVSF